MAEVEGRRALRLESMDAILADAESVTSQPYRTVGGWSAAENIDHVANVVEMSLDGFTLDVPWPLKVVGRLFLKPSWLKNGYKPGIRPPAKVAAAFAPREGVTLEQALERLRRMVTRSKSEPMDRPSPLLGALTHEQWEQMHCRHAELHLSFIVPEGSGGAGHAAV